MLINVSWAIRNYAVLVILGVGLLAGGIILAARTERGKDLIDIVKLRLPLFGTLIRKTVIARTCRTLALLLQSGVPLMEALDIATQVSGSRSIERALAGHDAGRPRRRDDGRHDAQDRRVSLAGPAAHRHRRGKRLAGDDAEQGRASTTRRRSMPRSRRSPP
jgi:hypothetical protein